VPTSVVKSSLVGVLAPHAQAVAVTQWHDESQSWPAPHWPCPHGGSQTSPDSTTPFPHLGIVVVVVVVVEVVVVAHGLDDGSQRSVILVLAFPAFALILQLAAFVPCFFVFTVTPVKLPHTELVPLGLTLSFPIPPAQWLGLKAWIFFLRLFGVQLAPGWLTHSFRLNEHLLSTAVAQIMLPSVTAPLVCSWKSVAH